MRLVLTDSLDYAENIDKNDEIISQTSCPSFWFSLKTYFFKLLLDHWSSFHFRSIVTSHWPHHINLVTVPPICQNDKPVSHITSDCIYDFQLFD